MADKEEALLGLKVMLQTTAVAPLDGLTKVYVQSLDYANVALTFPMCLLSYAEGQGNPNTKATVGNRFQHSWIARVFFALEAGSIGYPSPLFGQTQKAARGYATGLLALLDNDTTKWGGTISTIGNPTFFMRDNFTYWEWDGQEMLGLLCEIPVTQMVTTA
jgi:hypothetical protein